MCGLDLGSIGLMVRAVPLGFSVVELALELVELFELEPTRCRDLPCLRDSLENEDERLPSPLSAGVSASPMHLILTSTLPPAGVNFKLLLTRLMITWRIRCVSPQRHMSFNLPVP